TISFYYLQPQINIFSHFFTSSPPSFLITPHFFSTSFSNNSTYIFYHIFSTNFFIIFLSLIFHTNFYYSLYFILPTNFLYYFLHLISTLTFTIYYILFHLLSPPTFYIISFTYFPH
ncbi:hypothetical protein V8G54_034884, partial [Vigna mungo]